MKHQIEYKSLAEITPYDDNPRRNEAAVGPVANSIKEFGFQSPIIVDKDGVIIAGHTRYKAAKRLGLKEVPVVYATELTPEQVQAYRIADNSTGEVAEWDPALLLQELEGLTYDMADFGLDIQLDKIVDEAKDDDFQVEVPVEPVTRPGDIWILGEHRVMCGDSTSAQDMARLMDGEQADLLLTDPPYNVNYQGSNGKTIKNDNMDGSQFRQFLLQAFSRAFEVCRTGAAAYIFHADYQWQHEPCLYGWKPGAAHYFVNDRSVTTVIDDAKPEDLRKMRKDELLAWATKAQEFLTRQESTVLRYDKPKANSEHPTMKPVPLCGRLIKNSSRPGQLVLDEFGGSGSTLIACEQLMRKCYAMEYDPRYVDVIVTRWESFTGQKAVRA